MSTDSLSPEALAEIEQQFDVLEDATRSAQERELALTELQSEAFRGHHFHPFRARLTQALRTLATDPDPSLRRLALSSLAGQHDAFAQNLLIQGLQDPTAAVVSPVLALQFLSRDNHAPAVALAHDILANSADPAVRAEAAYILANDPSAAGLLATLMSDKTESGKVRRASAVSLRVLDREAFAVAAQTVADDSADYWEMRAVARNGLALMRDEDRMDGGDAA